MKEFEFISWLKSQTPIGPHVLVGPGDDTAVLAPPTRPLLITTDVLTEGVDFRVSEVEPRRIGRKAMAVNLSDIAAMAGAPTAAVIGLVLPNNFGPERAKELYLGLHEMADEFDVAIVGGDTNSWSEGLVLSVTVLGEATARGVVRRNGAKPGDAIFVTGPLGGSLLGHHLDFAPRIREALRLHELFELHAMIDVSDGLAADLSHILEESGCGAVLSAASIPIAPAAVERARQTGLSPLLHALGDGEDFELIFTLAPNEAERLLREQPVPGITCTRIGECISDGLWIADGAARRPLPPSGWVHDLS